jgi:hypothetical protein
MQSNPSVTCVMLTADRPKMAMRALECFLQQTYENKRLLIWDSCKTVPFWYEFSIKYGKLPSSFSTLLSVPGTDSSVDYRIKPGHLETIGALRNAANSRVESDIIIHWDDDDWSAPWRIEDQVSLLTCGKRDAVGYRTGLFWDSRTDRAGAWIYTNPDKKYCLGTSLCYWLLTWQAKPFENVQRGEDRRFITGLNTVGLDGSRMADEPAIICAIHEGNGSRVDAASSQWTRRPEFDTFCAEVMAL